MGNSHIIKSEINHDYLSGATIGGRLTIRLREGEQLNEVQHRLYQGGVTSSRRKNEAKRNNDFTMNQYDTKEQKNWKKAQN